MAEEQGVNNSSVWTVPMTQPSESHPDLVEVSSRSAYLKRAANQSPKSDIQRRLLAGIIVLVFLSAALVIAVGILSYMSNKASNMTPQPQVCTSNQCVETAANLLKSLDLDADPCEDFYQFTCGNWASNHPIPDFTASTDWFYERKLHLAQRIRKALENDIYDYQPVPVTQAQMLFQSCLNTTAIDISGVEPILQVLDHAGLPRKLMVNNSKPFSALYSYPTMSGGILTYPKPKRSSLSAELRWMVPLVGCKRVLGKDPLIGFGVLPHPLNRTNNVLTVASPSMRSPLPENELTGGAPGRHAGRHLQRWPSWTRRYNERSPWAGSPWKWRKSVKDGKKAEKKDDSAVSRSLYLESMMKLLDLWEALKNVTIDTTVVVDYVTNYRSDLSSGGGKKDVLKIYAQQIDALQEIIFKLYLESAEEDINIMSELSSGKDRPPPFDEMHVSDLQRLTDEAAFAENPNPNLRIDWRVYFNLMFEGSNVSLNLDKDFILVQNLNYLKNIAKLLAKTSPLVLEGLLWWEVMYVVAPHGNSLMRHLYNSYVEKITGGEIPRSRVMDCARVTNEMMGMAVSWLLAAEELAMNITSSSDEEGFTNIVEDQRFKVETMLSDIRQAFSELVLNLDWMDVETKKATLNKAEAMRSYIGYPSWLMLPDELETYYEGLTINITAYLQNIVNIVQVGEFWTLQGLRTKNDNEAWATDPTDVNAFHTFQENAVTIPAGILQFPFFGLGLEAMDYGAIGSVLGHELTHGFDNSGRHFDQNGNWRQWWTNRTIAEYINHTACFVNQYSSYLISEVNATVNGKQTLGENIADNGGMHEALEAFKRFKQRTSKSTDVRLPGLEQFSADHLLFIAFGSLWCEHGTNTTMKWTMDRDEHSPSKARVWGAVSNSEEFSRAFNCPVGSPMNPEVKCRIW